MKKYIYIICFFFFIFLMNVNAVEYINNVFTVTLDGNSRISNEEEIVVNINVKVNYELASILGDIIYDKDKLKLTNCESDYFTCTQTDKLLLDSTNGIKGNKNVAKLTFQVLDGFHPNDDVTIEFKNVEGDNNTAGNNSKITIHKLNNNVSLSTLTVENETLVPTFNSSITTYKVTTTKSYANISATSSSNVTGTGRKELDYGNNLFKIKVTAETGDEKEYLINVYREQPVIDNSNSSESNSNNSSSSSSTNNNSTNDNSVTNNKSYNNKTNSNSNNSSNSNTKSNSNSSSGSNNSSTETKNLSSNKKLNYFKIEGIDFEFDEDVFEYNININSDIEELNFDYEVVDKKSKVEISGDTKFTKKDNLVIVSVIAEDGSQVDYKIHVLKEDDDSEVIVNDIPDEEEIENNDLKKKVKNNNKNNYLIPAILLIAGIITIIIIFAVKKKK